MLDSLASFKPIKTCIFLGLFDLVSHLRNWFWIHMSTLYKTCRGDNNLSVHALANSLVIIQIFLNECTGSLKYVIKLVIKFFHNLSIDVFVILLQIYVIYGNFSISIYVMHLNTYCHYHSTNQYYFAMRHVTFEDILPSYT